MLDIKNVVSRVATIPNIDWTFTFIFDKDSDIWFIGREINECLGYSDPSQPVRDHVSDEYKTILRYKDFSDCSEMEQSLKQAIWSNPNDYSDKILINDSGLYDMLRASKKEKAAKVYSYLIKTTHSYRHNMDIDVDVNEDSTEPPIYQFSSKEELLATALKLADEILANVGK